jgi:hypothetical protein
MSEGYSASKNNEVLEQKEGSYDEKISADYKVILGRIGRSLNCFLVSGFGDDDNIKSLYLTLQQAITSLKNNPLAQPDLLEKIKLLTVSFLDLTKVDRMSSDESQRNHSVGRQRYGREDEDNVRKSSESLHPRYYVFNQDELIDWYSGLENVNYDTLFGKDEPISDLVENSEVGDQESVEDLINYAISQLEHLESSRSDRFYRRKAKVVLNSNHPDLEKFTERHKEHYRNFFTNSEGVSPAEVILTNSGARANEAVLNALVRQGCKKVFIQEGWYYENIATAQTNFEESLLNEAEVFFA